MKITLPEILDATVSMPNGAIIRITVPNHGPFVLTHEQAEKILETINNLHGHIEAACNRGKGLVLDEDSASSKTDLAFFRDCIIESDRIISESVKIITG